MPQGRTDLVNEMQQRKLAEQQAAQALRHQAEQAERDRRSKARTKTVLMSIAVVVGLALLAVAGKFAFDAHRIGNALQTARSEAQEGTPEALALAVQSLERGLEIEPEHPEVLAMLALVRAEQAIDESVPLETATAAIARAEASAPTAVATAIVSVLAGEYEEATAAIASTEPEGPDAGILRRAIAWTRGQVALHDLGDAAQLGPVLAAVDAALEDAPGWDRNYRLAAALSFQAGQVDRAFERLDQARALRPADTGSLVDRTLYEAVLQDDLEDAETIASQLLDAGTLGPSDAARARLARAIARRYDDVTDDDARSGLDEAFDQLPPWDRWARALAFEVALGSGATTLAEGWLDDALPPESAELYRAWIDFNEDHVAESLERTAKLSQTHPGVALVQGLALVEQGRFEEAKTWLVRAHEAFPQRPLVEVALLRVDANLEDPGEAADRLEALSKAYGHVPRVWTGLAEALIRGAKDGRIPKSADEPLEEALDREAHPAEAASLLARRRTAQSVDKPSLVPEAVELLRRAVALRDWVPRYREQLGVLLADVGDRDEARTILEGLAEEPTLEPTTLLLLAELATEHAVAQGKLPPGQVATWLAAAAQRGADAKAMAYAKARIALMAGTPDGVQQARAWIGPLLQADRKDLEARLLYIEVLRREGALNDARASVRTGLRKTPDARAGRLYLAWSEIERDAGKERQAASYAYKGWRHVAEEPRPANELLDAARVGIERWQAVRNGSGARSIGLGLTRRVPYRAEAWLLRADAQLEDDEPSKACKSAEKAISLDDSLVAAHVALADCRLAQRDRKGAAEALEEAAEKATDEREAKRLRRRARKLR